MRLAQGENHVISAREGLAVLQVWSRPDLTPEEGAKNAAQMTEYLCTHVLRAGGPYRGLIFDVRRGPPVFGPKTRETLASLFALAAQNRVGIAVLCGDSAIQVLQFRNLCRDAGGRAEVFASEAEAVRWFSLKSSGTAG
ncbi:MAG TPA: hypothetical protein VFZ53_02930 [Polyangiaceae bacterium]